MESSGARLNLVILDACRNNPFGGRGLRSSGAGLAQMQAPQGTLISFATQPGNVAIDGAGRNSPYTQALADAIRKPGVDIFRTFNEVGLTVASATGGVQQPWVSLSPIKGDFYFVPKPAEPAPKQAAPDDAAQRKLAEAQARIAALEEERRRAQTAEAQRKAEQESAAAAREREAEARRKAEQERSKVAVVAPPVTPSPPSQVKPAVGVFPSTPGGTPLSSERERSLKPKDSFKECDVCPEMIVIPAGSFMMGSPTKEKDRGSNESPQRRVTFARPFAVSSFEVTVDQFAAFVQETGHDAGSKCSTLEDGNTRERTGRSFRDPGYPQTGSHPASCLSWHDAKAYVAWLSKRTGKAYRLLSEAEWEYVARAGTTTPFWWGASISSSEANYNGRYTYAGGPESEFRKRAVSADSFKPNPFGLYQVYGNVAEWTEDCWNNNYRGAPTDGSAWTRGDCANRAVRGGYWSDVPWVLRSAARYNMASSFRGYGYGIRVARTLLGS
jgi:formylglycine-generating enzyme required for sulfatase activity